MTTNRFATRSADISVIGVVLVAGLVGGVLAAKTLDWAINGGALQALSVRPFAAGEQTAWFLSRASAIVAYLLLSGSMIWGLALSTKVVRDLVAPPLAAAMHSSLSWTAAGMAAFHAAVLLFDGYYHYTVADLLVPLSAHIDRSWWVLALLVFMDFSWFQPVSPHASGSVTRLGDDFII